MRDFDYSRVKHYKLYTAVRKIFSPAVKCVYKMKFKGCENIPNKGTKYIVAINHTCALDPVFVAIPKNMPELHFMAKSELFNNPIVGWFITHLYGFPVKRGQGDTSAIDYGEKIINEGHVMAICPEGKRIKDKNGVPQRAKSGVAIIAKATNASILPVAIYCKDKIKPFRSVTVSYGKLLTPEELVFNREDFSKEDIRNAADTVMQKITELREAEAE